jgi:hypothetical protein
MKFHDDTRAILKAATLLALSRGTPVVEIEHLLECDPRIAARVAYRDIPFSPEFIELLKKAADLASLESSSILRPRHLELALLTTWARTPYWGIGKPTDPVADVFDTYFQARLKGKGIHPGPLLKSLAGLTLRQCRPDPDFLKTSEGQRYLELVRPHTRHALARPILLLLAYLISGGPAAAPLTRAGLTEQVLIELLGDEVARFTVDFSPALGPGLVRLSPEARHTFHTAWRLRTGPQLESNDLLRGLIATLDPLGHPAGLRDLLEPLLPQLPCDHNLPELPTPDLSPEIYRVFSAALKEAGPEQQVTNPHLLIALSQCQNPLLTQHDLTPEKIRQALS